LNSTLKNFTVPLFSGTTQDGVYVINFTDLSAGTYTYDWYANDTSNNRNGTFPTLTYTIAKADTSLSVAPLDTVTYPTEIGTGCERVAGDSGSTLTLWRNNTNVKSGTTSPQNQTSQPLGAGVWNFTCTISASQNYSAGTSANNYLTISQNNTNPIKLFFRNATGEYLNGNITATYSSDTNATAVLVYRQSGDLNLYRNDILKNTENGTNITLGAGRTITGSMQPQGKTGR